MNSNKKKLIKSRKKTNLNKKNLISYLRSNGINIPNHWYNSNLSIAGNCRVFLIELGKIAKRMLYCATNFFV